MKKWFGISVLVLALDQLSKWIIVKFLAFQTPQHVFPFFNLNYTVNSGAAWGFLREAGEWKLWLFVSLSLGVSVVIVVWMWRLKPSAIAPCIALPRASLHSQERVLAAGLSFILGGAVGNLCDRIFNNGLVVDFLQFCYKDHCFPTFNIADSAIFIGASLVVLSTFWTSRKPSP